MANQTTSTTATQIPTQVPLDFWQAWMRQNEGKSVLINGQPKTIGVDVSDDDVLSAFRNNSVGWGNYTVSGQQAPPDATTPGSETEQPETAALAQMAQIDPTTEALRNQLAQSYLSTVGGGTPPPQFQMSQTSAGAPAAGDVQSYLDLYKQIDPEGYAQRAALGPAYDQYLQQVQQQAALGSQLDPGTIREVEQGTRSAQVARGNVYGTPQLVAETMARGSAGEQRLQQRQAALQSALGAQQGYLQSGVGLGDVANALYNQGYNRYLQGYSQQLNTWQAQQNALLNQRNQALSYLGSGQTPYQAGAAYYDRAQSMAAQAAGGGPSYQPSSLGQYYTGGGAGSYPTYGLEMGNQATNWYNSMVNQNLGLGQLANQRAQQSSAMGGSIGSGIGSILGGVVGSIVPGVGTAIGAAAGGALGGVAGKAMSA